MIEGKGHRVDSREIFIIEQVLLARQSPALSTEVSSKRPYHRVENRDCLHLNATATFLEQRAQRVADQSKENHPRIGLDPGDETGSFSARSSNSAQSRRDNPTPTRESPFPRQRTIGCRPLGSHKAAFDRSNRTLALARELGHAHSLALALCFAAMFRQFRREPLEAQELAQAAVTLCTEHQLLQWAAVGRFLLGWAIAQRGRSDEGIRQMRESLVEYQRIGAWLDLEWYFGVLAEALTANRYTDEGLAAVEQAQRVIRITDLHAPELHRLKGDLLLLERRQPEAEQSFLLALDTARRQGA
jgi:hypothetical protein